MKRFEQTPAHDPTRDYDVANKAYVDSVVVASIGVFGDPDTNGSWKILIVGSNLEVQRREGGVWVKKGAYTP